MWNYGVMPASMYLYIFLFLSPSKTTADKSSGPLPVRMRYVYSSVSCVTAGLYFYATARVPGCSLL